MTTLQILVLFAIFATIVLIFFAGYRSGHQDGHDIGHSEGKEHQSQMGAEYTAALRADITKLNDRITWMGSKSGEAAEDYLDLSRRHHLLLAKHSLADEDRAVLRAVASKLTLAAETFEAFPGTETQVARTLKLRDLVKDMVDRLEPMAETTADEPPAGQRIWLDIDRAGQQQPLTASLN